MTARSKAQSLVDQVFTTYDRGREREERLVEAIAGALEEREWRPIETAPKDGTDILVWTTVWSPPMKQGCAVVARWNDDRYATKPRPYWSPDHERLIGKTTARQLPPTHWMPLPEAPK